MSSEKTKTQREVRSFLMPRDPSIDRRFRPCPKTRERLFTEIVEENDCDDDSDSIESEYDDGRSSVLTECSEASNVVETGALVYLRLRPVEHISSAYSLSSEGNVLITGPPSDSSSSSNNKNSMEKHYSFSEIFDSSVSQRDVYDKCISQKIESAESLTILTYGTSGSGKTFTLLGDGNRPGIIPRSLENIFRQYQSNLYPTPFLKVVNGRVTFLDDDASVKENILRRKVLGSCPELEGEYANLRQRIAEDHNFAEPPLDPELSVLIWVSFVEIYNECVYDLLEPVTTTQTSNAKNNTTRKNLKIVCNDGKVFIKGLTSVFIKDSQEALRLLRWGLQKLTYASTAINANSSRSHCIFFVDVLKYYRSGVIAETSYKFCDLAGSERLDKTGNKGSRLKEAQRINTSLMILGRCLDAANSSTTRKNERIPFRESKLTMLLQSALLGKEKLAMIVNVTPTDKYYEENLNVLSFASIARNIVFKAPVVKQTQSRYSMFGDKTDSGYVQELLEENAWLRNDNEKLFQQNEELVEEAIRLRDERQQLDSQHADELAKLEHEIRIKLVDSFQSTLDENQKQFELRLQSELNNQKRIYESKIEFLKRKHEDEVEELREEIEELEKNDEKENVKQAPIKKRRTLH